MKSKKSKKMRRVRWGDFKALLKELRKLTPEERREQVQKFARAMEYERGR